MARKINRNARTLFQLVIFLAAILGFTQTLFAQVPQISQPLVPVGAVPGMGSFVLTVNGTGFNPGSVVNWNGSPLATQFVSSTKLTAIVTSEDTVLLGSAWVTVQNGSVPSNVVFFEITNPTNAVSFMRTDYTAGTSPQSIAVGDFNGDGKLDIVEAINFSSLSVRLGNGDGTFQTPVIYPAGGNPQSVTVYDVNGDGKLDLVMVNQGSASVSVLLGNGDGTFQAALNSPAPANSQQMAVGDFNGDGKLDLVVSNNSDSTISVLFGKGDGTFQSPVAYAVGSQPYSLVVGDLNGDGIPDLAVSNLGSNSISILIGNGDGTFKPATNVSLSAEPYFLTLADLNGDGKLDLVVGFAGTNSFGVMLGNGNGTFQAPVNYFLGPVAMQCSNQCVAQMFLGDFNGDGKLDLAVASPDNNNVSLLLGNGDGTFQSATSYPTGTAPFNLAEGDFNRDGRLDLAVSDQNSGTLSILRASQSITQPLSPTAPNQFNFGPHNFTVQYPAGTEFSGVNMTVVAVQATQAGIQKRFAGTPFANAACIVYSGTGGNCVDYQVTCSTTGGSQITCPGTSSPTITVKTSFDTLQPITNPGFLITPIGTNDWTNIFDSFFLQRIDPTMKGKTSGFSEFVAVDLGATNNQGAGTFQFLAPLQSNDQRIFPVGTSIPVRFQLKSVTNPAVPITDAVAGITVVMISDANGNPTSNLVLEKPAAFVFSGGNYVYSLNTTGYAPGTYNITVYGNAFVAQQVEFTLPAPTSGARISTTLQSLTLNKSNQYVAVFKMTNKGTGAANGLTVTASKLNSAASMTFLPISMGDVNPGSSANVTLSFPASAGTPKSSGEITISESYAGGTAGGGFRVTLP